MARYPEFHRWGPAAQGLESRDISRPDTRGQEKIHPAVRQNGHAWFGMSLYWSKHLVKCEIALAKGKKEYDKRDTERERDASLDLQRAVRNKGKYD